MLPWRFIKKGEAVKKGFAIFLGLFLALILAAAQEIAHRTTVVNIEVPVRVFDRGKFVDHLKMDDFEVYENGRLQEIVAVYLVKKTTVERKMEAIKETKAPETSRNFIFIFSVSDYHKKIDEALDYFFSNVMLQADTVRAVSPLRTYRLIKGVADELPKQEIKNKLAGILRKDINRWGADHRSLHRQIEDIVDMEALDLDIKRSMCLELLRKMRDLDQIDESSLLKISNQLKQIEGQKIVFLFYQKEALPIPAFLADEAPLELRRGISLDVELIKKAFSDASIIIHFIFLTNKPSDEDNITRFAIPNLAMQDNSDSFFSAFTSLAKTTGGLTQSSANAAASFKRAMDATENYYLLYYHPSDYKQDGQFKEIKVKIKNSNYTVTHRAGYIAD